MRINWIVIEFIIYSSIFLFLVLILRLVDMLNKNIWILKVKLICFGDYLYIVLGCFIVLSFIFGLVKYMCSVYNKN